jgi:hypothetical protein
MKLIDIWLVEDWVKFENSSTCYNKYFSTEKEAESFCGSKKCIGPIKLKGIVDEEGNVYPLPDPVMKI